VVEMLYMRHVLYVTEGDSTQADQHDATATASRLTCWMNSLQLPHRPFNVVFLRRRLSQADRGNNSNNDRPHNSIFEFLYSAGTVTVNTGDFLWDYRSRKHFLTLSCSLATTNRD